MKKSKRGYPDAILAGFEENKVVLWKVFSHMIKPEKNLQLSGMRKDPKALYNFHESIINAIRPTFKEGVRSIILVAPIRTNYAQTFLEHIRAHHAWLSQGQSKAIFSEISGSATTLSEVAALAKTPALREVINETTKEETEKLIELLEERLNASTRDVLVLYSLEEVEDALYGSWKIGKPKPEYLLLSDTYLSRTRQKGRIQKLIQIASNKGIKARIVKGETPAGNRILQLGGIVCVMKQG